MVMMLAALLWGLGQGNTTGVTLPGPDLWRQDAAGMAYWDYQGDGVIDVADLAYFWDVWFEDVTQAAGLVTSHHAVADYFGIGQAWGDYDNDGWLDLYVTDSDGPNTLFRNNGDGTFSVSPLNGLVSFPQYSSGALWADYDNDGWLDLYILNDGPNTLLRGLGGTSFEDVTLFSGTGDDNRGMSGAWGDLNGDGWLDLYVVNWGEPGEKEDGLYLNNGDGSFTDLSALLGPRGDGPGCTLSFVDFDNDRDLDIYVVNDKLWGNVLWRNDGPGCGGWCLTDISSQAGADTQVWGMGLAVGDYDGDMDLDFYFSHMGPMVLLQNQTSQGAPVFQSAGAAAGVDFETVGWGAVFFDVDNDSWLDLYLATSLEGITNANRMYRNQGNGTFADRSHKAGTAHQGFSMGVAYADYDRDGHLDFVIGNRDGSYVLYRNKGRAGLGNQWLNVRLTGTGLVNRDAVGARVYVTLNDGRTLMQEVKCGSSLGAGNDLALHFGLGTAAVQQMNVIWPNGATHAFGNIAANQFLSLTYPDQLAVSNP